MIFRAEGIKGYQTAGVDKEPSGMCFSEVLDILGLEAHGGVGKPGGL